MDWTTAADVALHLGAVADDDPRLIECVDASNAWCQRQRPDLDPDLPAPSDVYLAATLYAAFLFRLRTTPQGLPSDTDLGQYDTADSMWTIRRLLGTRKPVAR